MHRLVTEQSLCTAYVRGKNDMRLGLGLEDLACHGSSVNMLE